MSTRLATIVFPDGSRRYTMYTIVVNALYEDLYRNFRADYPDARGGVTGPSDPSYPEAPISPPEELVPVQVVERDATWHALFCPRRQRLVGPMSPYHRMRLAEWYQVVDGEDGRRHLHHVLDFDPKVTSCGQEITEPDREITDDLFATWAQDDACHACLMAQLPEVDEDPRTPFEA
jgi:hypothetical protein